MATHTLLQSVQADRLEMISVVLSRCFLFTGTLQVFTFGKSARGRLGRIEIEVEHGNLSFGLSSHPIVQ